MPARPTVMGSTLGGALVSVSQLSSYRSNLRHGHQASGGARASRATWASACREKCRRAGWAREEAARRRRQVDGRARARRRRADRAFSATIGFCRRSFGARNCGRARSPNVPAWVENIFRRRAPESWQQRGESRAALGSELSRATPRHFTAGRGELPPSPLFILLVHVALLASL